jgi:predicted PurR-regulated permease PerM
MSLFAIAVVWPVQKRLEDKLPQLAALAVTLLLTVLAIGTLIALSVWALGQVGRWLIVNADHLEALYAKVADWFEGHGIFVLGLFVERFDVLWLARPFQILATQARELIGFSLLVLVFMMLGLLEVRGFNEKLVAACGDRGARLSALFERMAEKFRRYMVIRTIASILTGLTVGALCWVVGVQLPYAWGVLAFVLNFIPFIGPFFATVLPALFAIAQFHAWETPALILMGVSVVQFLIGSYLEPRMSGSALTMSPFLVVFSVFFGALLWGIPGAFIGVPMATAILMLLQQNPSTALLPELLSGKPSRSDRA